MRFQCVLTDEAGKQAPRLLPGSALLTHQYKGGKCSNAYYLFRGPRFRFRSDPAFVKSRTGQL